MKPTFGLRFLLLPVFLLFVACAPGAQTVSFRFPIPDSDDGLSGQGPIRRYDWFRKTWNDRRSAFADRAQQDRGAVVMLGDSITQGWDDDFSAWLPGMKIANRGISGDT